MGMTEESSIRKVQEHCVSLCSSLKVANDRQGRNLHVSFTFQHPVFSNNNLEDSRGNGLSVSSTGGVEHMLEHKCGLLFVSF